jgi:hypothetical protein
MFAPPARPIAGATRLSAPTEPPATLLAGQGQRSTQFKRAVNAARVVTLVVVLLTGMATTSSASVRPRDIRSTKVYLHAYEVLLRTEIADAPAQITAAGAFVRRISVECPKVLVGAPKVPQLVEIKTEIGLALAVPLEGIERPAIESFAARVERLRWSSRTLTASVKVFAEQQRTNAAIAAPHLCADLRSWVEGGYRELPATAQHFLAQVHTGSEEDSVILASLRRYEGPRLRSFAQSVEKLMRKIQVGQSFIFSFAAEEASEAVGLPGS